MPIVDYECGQCGEKKEVLLPIGMPDPTCCHEVMTRLWTIGNIRIKYSPPLWVGRIDEIHKAQEQRGERLRLPHPKEVGAN